MKRLYYFLIPLALISSSLKGQIGGNNTYEFVNLNSSARVAALGGNQIAVKDDDVFLGVDNPALLNEKMSTKMAFTYVSYLAGINYGIAAYAQDFKKVGTFSLGIKYVDYGKFTEYDITGTNVGEFSAGEYAFILGYGRQISEFFSVGANLKPIYSSFYDKSSIGILGDLGVTFEIPTAGITFSMMGKNMGSQMSTYVENAEKEDMPFEVQFGLTKKLEKVPIRFGLIFQQMQQWDLTYTNPNKKEESSILGAENQNKEKNGFLENLGRHLVFNAEFLLTKNFNIRFGYNYLRRAELKIDEKLGTVGISWGLGMRISKFHLSYARSAYHQVGATNTFSVSTQLSDFIN